MNTFSHIRIKGWRQFECVDIDLQSQVTMLTGRNCTGKSTVLNILAEHFGWSPGFVSTPFLANKTGNFIFSDFDPTYINNIAPDKRVNIGSIDYSNNSSISIYSDIIVGPNYKLIMDERQDVDGIHIPSHRPPVTYFKVTSIPTDPKQIRSYLREFQQNLFESQTKSASSNPGVVIKKSLLSLATFGPGNEAVLPNNEYKNLYDDFQTILREIIPDNIGFLKLEIRLPDVVLITRSGDFSLDSMSGGINDLILMAWHIHMYSLDKKSLTVIIDEPENHLHPSIQRSLMPSFSKAFPKHKFIIATHSPIIVSSLKDSSVYGFLFNSNNKVSTLHLDESQLSGTPNKILREIFDVPSNLPIWVEDQIRQTLESIKELTFEQKNIRLIQLLDKLGFTDQITDIDFEK